MDAYSLLARTMDENGNYGRADMRAAWEHILTFDESIPANARATADAREQLEKMGPVSQVEITFPKREW